MTDRRDITDDAGDILIVDDSPEARLIRGRALRRAGFDVRHGISAAEGYAAIAERRPDVVILDVNLPDAHGFDVCRRIKAEHVDDPIAVVQVSASSVGTDAQVSGLEGGADAYLTEPIDPSVLVATVRAVLRERRTSAALRRANARLGFAQRAAGAGVWDLDPATGDAWWSDELAGLHGLPAAGERTVAAWLDSIHPDDRAAVEEAIRARARDGAPLDVEARLTADALRWVHLTGRLEHGRLAGLTVDITRRRRTQEQLRALQELTASLSATVRPGDVLDTAVRATWRALDTDTSSIGVRRGDTVDVTFGVPHAALEERYARLDLTDERLRRLPAAQVAMGGEVVAVNGAEAIAARYPVLAADPDLAGISALLIVPLRSPRRVRGFLAAYSYRAQTFGPEDLDALTAIAQVCSQSLERAELYAAEADARTAAEAAGRRSRLRAEAIEQLERLRTLAERRAALVTFCADTFGAEARLEPPGDGTDAGGGGDDPGRAAVMLVSRGTALGRLELRREGAPFTGGDRQLLAEIAGPAALSLDNARLDDEQRRIARTLQAGLLQGAQPPLPPGVSAALRYLPAEAGLHVGGDWHDVIPRPDGRVAVVVGDVAGHGLAAATTMGVARNAARALARVLDDPAAVLAELDGLVGATAAMATAACAILDPATGALVYACAGHPPPLLLTTDGAATMLEGGRAMPLAGFEPERPSAHATVGAGEIVLLYTDGLFERRGQDLRESLADLEREAARLAAGSPTLSGFVDALIASMTGDGPVPDDVAVLALRRSLAPGEAASWRVPTAELATLREVLDTHLAACGAAVSRRAEAGVLLADIRPLLAATERSSDEVDLEVRRAPDGTVHLALSAPGAAAGSPPRGWRRHAADGPGFTARLPG